jgi:hypothetical protein
MRRRTVVLGLVAWAAVVAAGSGVTWLVIDAAGQQVLGDRPAEVMVAPTPNPFPSLPASIGPSTTIAASPSLRPLPVPVPSSPAPRPAPSPSPHGTAGPPSPARDSSVVRTWRGGAGTVVARCRRNAVSLDSATPSDGYRAEVGSRGPREVEVTFAGPGNRLKVRATCDGGEPSFSTEYEGTDG